MVVARRSGGKKTGVSLQRNATCAPLCSSRRRRKAPYLSGDHPSLKRCRSSGITRPSPCLDEKLAAAHDLAIVGPNVEIPAHNVNVRGRTPFRPRMPSVWIAEGHVNSGNLFVLKNIADHFVNRQVGPDRELSHAVTVFVPMRVFPELFFEFLVLALRRPQSVPAHFKGQWCALEIAELRTQVIAHDPIDHERAVYI